VHVADVAAKLRMLLPDYPTIHFAGESHLHCNLNATLYTPNLKPLTLNPKP